MVPFLTWIAGTTLADTRFPGRRIRARIGAGTPVEGKETKMRSGRLPTSRARALAAAVLLVAPTFGAVAARAGDGVQFSRDCDRTYINKQVGDSEQWAITWEVYGDATGNVLKLDGTEPSFIECVLVGEDASDEIFDCYGSSACSGPPCGGSGWGLIASGVSIPLGFFLPPDVDPLNPFDDCEVAE
jgi:hypothetical protein